jgi:hypothetical protein
MCAQVGTLALAMALPPVVAKYISISSLKLIPVSCFRLIFANDCGIVDTRPRKHLWQLRKWRFGECNAGYVICLPCGDTSGSGFAYFRENPNNTAQTGDGVNWGPWFPESCGNGRVVHFCCQRDLS